MTTSGDGTAALLLSLSGRSCPLGFLSRSLTPRRTLRAGVRVRIQLELPESRVNCFANEQSYRLNARISWAHGSKLRREHQLCRGREGRSHLRVEEAPPVRVQVKKSYVEKDWGLRWKTDADVAQRFDAAKMHHVDAAFGAKVCRGPTIASTPSSRLQTARLSYFRTRRRRTRR